MRVRGAGGLALGGRSGGPPRPGCRGPVAPIHQAASGDAFFRPRAPTLPGGGAGGGGARSRQQLLPKPGPFPNYSGEGGTVTVLRLPTAPRTYQSHPQPFGVVFLLLSPYQHEKMAPLGRRGVPKDRVGSGGGTGTDDRDHQFAAGSGEEGRRSPPPPFLPGARARRWSPRRSPRSGGRAAASPPSGRVARWGHREQDTLPGGHRLLPITGWGRKEHWLWNEIGKQQLPPELSQKNSHIRKYYNYVHVPPHSI